jgi:glyoxylase-like metal-dependent hydrolase (beta-lactamase superfamily II)
VQQKEYDYLTAPDPAAKAGYEPDLVLRTEYELVDGDIDIIPGISVVLAPGHSMGMQCVVVETRAGKYVLGGDLITLFENWEAEPHVPNGVFYDLNIMLESLEKINRINGTVLPGHDEEVFNRSIIYPPQ